MAIKIGWKKLCTIDVNSVQKMTTIGYRNEWLLAGAFRKPQATEHSRIDFEDISTSEQNV